MYDAQAEGSGPAPPATAVRSAAAPTPGPPRQVNATAAARIHAAQKEMAAKAEQDLQAAITEVRARVSDGSTVPKAVWDKNILPDMKAAVAKVMSCYRFTPKEHMQTAQYKDLYENKAAPRLAVPAKDMGELQIMGWDFMVGSENLILLAS